MPYVSKLTPRQEAFVRRFEEENVKYFYTVMKTTHLNELVKGKFACQLEFPVRFLGAHADEFDDHATLETKSRGRNSNKKWPLGITVRYIRSERRKRVFAYGNKGWRRFCIENKIKIGDLLVFQLIGFSRFRAYVFPAEHA